MKLPDETELAELVGEAFRVAKQSPDTIRAGWGVRFTPPLPEPWPTPEAVAVFAYGIALPIVSRDGRQILAAADAMLVGHPFAAVYLSEGRSPEVVVLATSLQSAGMQGFGPASPAEISLAARRAEVVAEILGLSPPLSDLARTYFRYWLSVSGVIARCLPALPRRFLGDIDDRYA